MEGDFSVFDAALAGSLTAVPASTSQEELASNATSAHEVLGWSALFDSQDYKAASEQFEHCANSAASNGTREMAGFFRFCQAKATYLNGVQGNVVARNSALDVFEQAIECGAKSAWFNRLRSSLNRHRSISTGRLIVQTDYPFVVAQVFDELLERVGPRGHRFQRWADQVSQSLNSTSHSDFQQGLQRLGEILGYSVALPRYGASTDCRWRGIFGNAREIVTFEVKIEHEPSNTVTPTALGQAHNQATRAKSEFEARGFTVRGTIVTHLSSIDRSAESSLGEVRILRKDAILGLWQRVLQVLSEYRDDWDLENVEARLAASEQIVAKLPPASWLTRALSNDGTWITADDLLEQWP